MRDPLTERDYVEIRAAVMTEVRRRGRRRSTGAWKLVFVPALTVLAIVLMPSHYVTYDTHPVPRAAITQPVAVVAQAKPHHVKRHHKEVIQLASAEVTRMDIQTADPDVRIIWFARQEDSK